MGPLEAMTTRERSLFNLERALIARSFPGLTPRLVRLAEAADYDALARDPRLVFSAAQADAAGAELVPLMTHMLLHYEMKDAGQAHWYGHGPYFTRRATELGMFSDTLRHRCFSIDDWLDNPFLRSGRHAVNARVNDVVFGLARAYDEELNDFFVNERWLRGGHRLPESLLPFVKFYAEELTDLLAVGATVTQLTQRAR
jgi:hypothetical protein